MCPLRGRRKLPAGLRSRCCLRPRGRYRPIGCLFSAPVSGVRDPLQSSAIDGIVERLHNFQPDSRPELQRRFADIGITTEPSSVDTLFHDTTSKMPNGTPATLRGRLYLYTYLYVWILCKMLNTTYPEPPLLKPTANIAVPSLATTKPPQPERARALPHGIVPERS